MERREDFNMDEEWSVFIDECLRDSRGKGELANFITVVLDEETRANEGYAIRQKEKRIMERKPIQGFSERIVVASIGCVLYENCSYFGEAA
jgi:hypothetical protein